MTRMNTEICWRSSVLTALIIYPQMLDRCYTDFHLFQICLTSVDCIGPQADGVGEQGLINDERLMITDFVHTENAEGKGGPQADEVGEQQLSSIGQQLKENIFYCRSRKRVGGLWSGIAINDQQLKEINVYPQMTQMEVRRRTVLENAYYGELTVN